MGPSRPELKLTSDPMNQDKVLFSNFQRGGRTKKPEIRIKQKILPRRVILLYSWLTRNSSIQALLEDIIGVNYRPLLYNTIPRVAKQLSIFGPKDVESQGLRFLIFRFFSPKIKKLLFGNFCENQISRPRQFLFLQDFLLQQVLPISKSNMLCGRVVVAVTSKMRKS